MQKTSTYSNDGRHEFHQKVGYPEQRRVEMVQVIQDETLNVGAIVILFKFH